MREAAKAQSQTIFDGTYELLSTLGRGGRSVVYKARLLAEPSRTIALKVFTGTARNPDETIRLVKREALALLSSRHRNVVRVFDYVATHSRCYLAMEFAAHGDTRDRLSSAGAFEPLAALNILKQLLAGLESIHRVGIFHCDIKPENLLLTENNEVKISDFGVSILPTERRSPEQLSAANGTLDYLAPELLNGAPVSESTDLYSAGITFYQLLTNSLPFTGETIAASIEAKIRGVRRPVGNIAGSPLLEKLLDRALHPDPEARFQNATDFRAAVDYVIEYTEQAEKNLAQQSTPIVPTRVTYPDESEGVHTDRKQRISWKRAFYYSVSSFIIGAGVVTGIFGKREIAVASLSSGAVTEQQRAVGFWEGVKTAVHSTSVAPFAKIARLTSGTHVGTIENLLAEGEPISLMTRGIDGTSRFVLSLGIPGWMPRTIQLSPEATSNELRINANGLRLSLWVNTEESGTILSGRFRDNTTGRQGRWQIQ